MGGTLDTSRECVSVYHMSLEGECECMYEVLEQLNGELVAVCRELADALGYEDWERICELVDKQQRLVSSIQATMEVYS